MVPPSPAVAFLEGIKAKGTPSITVKYKLGGGVYTSLGSVSLTATETWYNFRSYQNLTQTQIDGFEGGLLTPSMGSSDDIYIDMATIKVFTTPYLIKDRRPTGNELRGCFLTGKASPWMVYA